jgi:VCBS repeat-containing protein
MKKLFSLMLVAVLLLGLSASAMAADDTTDIIINVLEDNPITLPFSGSLSGSDFWIETRYGHIQLNDDGSYRYKVNKENPALNAAMESGWGVVDQLVLTFPIWDGIWEGREVTIAIQPEGTKGLGYWTTHTVTDLDATLEGTILLDGESTDELLLRVPLGRLKISQDGEYSYQPFVFLEAVQGMRENWVREDRLGIYSNGTGEDYDLVIRTYGDGDDPTVQSRTYNLESYDDIISGNALDGSTQGDGLLSEHTFKWVLSNAKYGTFSFNNDGSYRYTPDSSIVTDEKLTETFVFTYADADGDTATGRIVINYLPTAV